MHRISIEYKLVQIQIEEEHIIIRDTLLNNIAGAPSSHTRAQSCTSTFNIHMKTKSIIKGDEPTFASV